MEVFVVAVFILAYVTITMEHKLKIDKLIPALLSMTLSWAFIALGMDSFTSWFNPETSKLINISRFSEANKMLLLEKTLLHHFGKTVEILFFLIGAMTIVEIIDHFEGFGTIKKMIKTKNKRNLLWILSLLAFFLSAIIDNLTATIVLITILRKLIPDKNTRMWYTAFVIIAANAGGAWTPIGDVTTTMLWMANKVTSAKLLLMIGLPSLVNILIPLIIASFLPVFKGDIETTQNNHVENKNASFMLYLGLMLIVCVPIFKTLTHLPPYMGMLFSLAIFALVAEFLTYRKFSLVTISDGDKVKSPSPTLKAIEKIEMPTVLFFLGILMAVAALESLGLIMNFGNTVNESISSNVFVTILGFASAIVDNVPLVAASLGMFKDVPDADVWHLIAYATGTGGSMLIIGSAAGVVAMGMEKISFGWFLKNVTFLALIGYLSGIAVFFGLQALK